MSNELTQTVIAALVLVALIFLNAFGVLAPIMDGGRLGVNVLVTPLATVLRWIRDLTLAFFAIHDLVSQNEYLTRQVETLNLTLARYEKASSENRVLREALGFQAETKLDLLPAELLSFDYLNFDQRALLNRGRRDGAAIGDNVVAAGGILVGILTDVSDRTSQMELITSSGQAVNARTTINQAAGIVRGEHGLGLVFDQVSLFEEVAPEDRVVTSGLGGKFIPNLYIGKVSEVNTRPGDLFRTATVIPAVDFRNLQIVFVVRNQ